ncbi:MAG TPA: hypothetical protein ENI19_01330 [Candidatus Nealsonbacteria bacterium]|uniref:SHS2 domain-containing protein n=1 Tax=marine sediment metagenome TaxID=412755 RepID=A0A0F9VCN4_9ZZZZ|nr:hypothetical protein [Candidatus Nealsonbacteria bacterium]HEB46334.1 hypothetical protein [Candidatus Nealsonbacteria bacterium]
MIGFPALKQKKEIFLALDIGTEAIKSLIFTKEKEKNIILGADLKEYYRLGIQDGADLDKEVMKEAILEVVSQAKKQAKTEMKECLILWRLPGNILKEKIVLNSFQRKNPKKIIDQEEEDEIYHKIINQTQQEVSQGVFQESGILPKDIHFIDFKILERKMDGYQINQLTGISGQNLVFRILFTFLAKNYLENVKKITKDLGLERLKIVSEAENLCLAFSSQKITAVFLDIGGKFTQIVSMKEGKLQTLSGFEMGGEIFSQKLSQILGITKIRAEDLKIRYAQRTLSEEVRKRISEILLYDCRSWFSNLKLKLREISRGEEKILPQTILLFGGGSLLPEIEEILAGEEWDDLPFLNRPQVKFISPKDLKNIEDRAKIISTIQYIPSLLLCYTP